MIRTRSRTDGDAIVVIKTAYDGDLFAEKALPVVDSASGGSALALPETLARAAREITGVDRVVTGHAAWPGNRPATGGALLGWPRSEERRVGNGRRCRGVCVCCLQRWQRLT